MSTEAHDGQAFRVNAWNYQEILADLKSRYDDPIQAFGCDDATELVNLAQSLEPTQSDHEERRDFVDMLRGMERDYKGDDACMYNPENTDEYIWHEELDWQLDEKYLE